MGPNVLTLAILASFFSMRVTGGKVYEARVFANAPPNTTVTLDPAFMRNFLENWRICFIEIHGTREFSWNYGKQTLETASFISIPCGKYYQFGFAVQCPSSNYAGELQVRVAEYNIYKPKFGSNQFDLHIHPTSPTSTYLGTLQATDDDYVIYNAELTYHLINDTFNLLSLNGSTGSITAYRSIDQTTISGWPYMVQVEACDFGSPQMCDSSIVKVHLVNVTGPTKAEVVFANPEYQVFCWEPPQFGDSEEYILRVEGSSSGEIFDENFRRELGRQCAISRFNLTEGTTWSAKFFSQDIAIDVPSPTSIPFEVQLALNCSGICHGPGIPICILEKSFNQKVEAVQFKYKGLDQCLCDPGHYGNLCQHIHNCQPQNETTIYGIIIWDQKPVFDTLTIPCPYGPPGVNYAVGRCSLTPRGDGAVWQKVNSLQKCTSEDSLIHQMGSLKDQLRHGDSKIGYQVIRQLRTNFQTAVMNPKAGDLFVDVISTALSKDCSQSLEDQHLSFKYYHLLHEFADKTDLGPNGHKVIRTPLLELQVQEITNCSEDINKSLQTTSIHVPSATLEEIQDSLALGEPLRLKAITYRRILGIFRSRGLNPLTVLELDFNVRLNSSFPEPVVYSMEYSGDEELLRHYRCVYWDVGSETWISDGLEWIGVDQSGRIGCGTRHMTGFSILLDFGYDRLITPSDRNLMNLLSRTGCGISMLGLFLTILTYCLFPCLSRDRAGKILINLCSSLFLLNLVFIISSLKSEGFIRNRILCGGIAVSLHYATMASLFWMGVEALNMYRMVVRVFASTEKFFMIKRCILAWGIPAVVVCSTANSNFDYYTSQASDEFYCQLSRKYHWVYRFAYLIPACTILCFNCIIFVLIIKVLFRSGAQLGRKTSDSVRHLSRNTTARVHIKGSLSVMVLLGVTWIFGGFAVGPAKIPFAYIFCVLNSMQGFIIFLVRCLFYEEARIAWMMFLLTGRLKKYRGKVPSEVSSGSFNSGRRATKVSMNGSQVKKSKPLDANPYKDKSKPVWTGEGSDSVSLHLIPVEIETPSYSNDFKWIDDI